MTHLTTELVAKSLAQATEKDSENGTFNLFESVRIIDNDDNTQAILVKQDEDGASVFITVDEEQVRTVSYLWDLDEIQAEQRESVMLAMLKESMSLPLVSFGVHGNEVTLFGSMSTSSGVDELVEEVEALFSATHMVVTSMEEASSEAETA
jgi:uncharacterized protein YjfI (DUF2170 family)